MSTDQNIKNSDYIAPKKRNTITHATSCVQYDEPSDTISTLSTVNLDDDDIHVDDVNHASNAVSQSTIHEMMRSTKSTENCENDQLLGFVFIIWCIFGLVVLGCSLKCLIECEWLHASNALETVVATVLVVCAVCMTYMVFVVMVYAAAVPRLQFNVCNITLTTAMYACYLACCFMGYKCGDQCTQHDN